MSTKHPGRYRRIPNIFSGCRAVHPPEASPQARSRRAVLSALSPMLAAEAFATNPKEKPKGFRLRTRSAICDESSRHHCGERSL